MIETAAINSQDSGDRFFSAAYQRILRAMLLLLPSVAIGFWMFFNHRFAVGFLIGGAIAIVNFMSLKKLVIAFAERVIRSGGQQRSSGLVLRFVLRYGLIAGTGYAIFKSSAMSAYGIVAGLTIPAGAVMIEAAYELCGSIRKGH